MKRLALLLVVGALLLPVAANAQLTMQMSNGWSFSFAGNVNAFWVITKQTNSGPLNSSIRTGLLPAFATFEANGKEAGMNLGVHFGFAPQINNAGVHDQFGAQIDMRQVFLTVGGKWGSFLAGRELGLFSRQNIVNDMTLFGVGAVGIRGAPGTGPQGGGTTLGRIGYGYVYANFVPQFTYTSKAGSPMQLSVGLFQPAIIVGTAYTYTGIPRVEAEVTLNQKSGANKFMAWAGALWQTTSNAPSGGTSVTSFGGTVGVRAGLSALSVLVSAYIGSAIGNVLMFEGATGNEVSPTGDPRKSDGGYVQVTYAMTPKTTVGASYGFSRFKNASAGETVATGGNDAVRTQWTSATVGIYNQRTKSLKLVLEATREQEGIGAGSPAQLDFSPGIMLFF